MKLMGRHAGWISVYATLSNRDVNFCLIPEIPFELQGPLVSNSLGVPCCFVPSVSFLCHPCHFCASSVSHWRYNPVVFLVRKGLFQAIYDCLKSTGRCVIVVAEGAGLDHVKQAGEVTYDESGKDRDRDANNETMPHVSFPLLTGKGTLSRRLGNMKLPDIGLFLKKEINGWFQRNRIEVNLKYVQFPKIFILVRK